MQSICIFFCNKGEKGKKNKEKKQENTHKLALNKIHPVVSANLYVLYAIKKCFKIENLTSVITKFNLREYYMSISP